MVLQQTMRGIETGLKSGQTGVRLQLQPEELGRIDLHMVRLADGLHVNLTAEAPATGALLERYLPDLAKSLLEAGVNLAGLNIGQGHSRQDADGERRSPRAQPASHGAAPVDAASPTQVRRSLTASMLDIQV
jgi:flagellar hook-length control protein FliK